jgi:peptide alpha-N-acetyltransferase
MRYEDQLRSHPGYFKGALSAIGIYVQISDDPRLTEERLSEWEFPRLVWGLRAEFS